MFVAKFDTYVPSRVNIVMEHILVTYHAIVPMDWNRSTTKENIYATDLTQEEKYDAFFEQVLADLMNNWMLSGKVFGKFGLDWNMWIKTRVRVHVHDVSLMILFESIGDNTNDLFMRVYTSLSVGGGLGVFMFTF